MPRTASLFFTGARSYGENPAPAPYCVPRRSSRKHRSHPSIRSSESDEEKIADRLNSPVSTDIDSDSGSEFLSTASSDTSSPPPSRSPSPVASRSPPPLSSRSPSPLSSRSPSPGLRRAEPPHRERLSPERQGGAYRHNHSRTRTSPYKLQTRQRRMRVKALMDIGRACFSTVRNATWCQNEGTMPGCMQVKVHGENMEIPMPTHLVHVVSEDREAQELVTPIHAQILQAHCVNLNGLPKSQPMQIYTPVTSEATELVDEEFASGDIPIIHLHLDNVETFPTILNYCYSRNAGDLLSSLIGSRTESLAQYVNKDPDFEQHLAERTISKQIASKYRRSTIEDHIQFVELLSTNANILGMDDVPFWRGLNVAQRVLKCAILQQDNLPAKFEVHST